MTSTRGKVIKTPDATPGLLYVNAQQQPFQLERVWQSPVAPAPNMAVDVEFNEGGAIQAIRAIPDSQLAKEQAALALDSANEKGKVLASSLIARVGKPALIATGLLAAGYFFFDYFSVANPYLGTRFHFTYWQCLGWINFLQDAAGNPLQVLVQGARPDISAGIYGLLLIVSLAGPLLPAVWKDRRAVLGGLLPLAFNLLVAIQVWRIVESAKGIAQAQLGITPQMAAAMAEQATAAQEQLLKLFSVGMGGYLVGPVVLYLAVAAVVKFLARKGADAV